MKSTRFAPPASMLYGDRWAGRRDPRVGARRAGARVGRAHCVRRSAASLARIVRNDHRRGEVRLRAHGRRRAQAARVIARVAERVPMRIVPTWLGAHEIPQEYRAREWRPPVMSHSFSTKCSPPSPRNVSRGLPTSFASLVSSPPTRPDDPRSIEPRRARRSSSTRMSSSRPAGRSSQPPVGRDLGRSPRGDLRGRNRRARRLRHRRHPATRDHALPRAPASGASARPD